VISIYVLWNIQNGKFYIGSAAKAQDRKRIHFWNLRKGTHPNRHLQSAFRKYGEKSFRFDIITTVSAQERRQTEGAYISLLFSYDRKIGYNICPASIGGPLAEESREKLKRIPHTWSMGMKHSQEALAKMSAANRGKTLSAIHRAKISASHIGIRPDDATRKKLSIARKRRPMTAEWRAKISAANRASWAKRKNRAA